MDWIEWLGIRAAQILASIGKFARHHRPALGEFQHPRRRDIRSGIKREADIEAVLRSHGRFR